MYRDLSCQMVIADPRIAKPRLARPDFQFIRMLSNGQPHERLQNPGCLRIGEPIVAMPALFLDLYQPRFSQMSEVAACR